MILTIKSGDLSRPYVRVCVRARVCVLYILYTRARAHTHRCIFLDIRKKELIIAQKKRINNCSLSISKIQIKLVNEKQEKYCCNLFGILIGN